MNAKASWFLNVLMLKDAMRPVREEAVIYLKCAADAVMVLRTGWLTPRTECVSGFDFAREALGVSDQARRAANEAVDRVLRRRGVSRKKVDAMHPCKAAMLVFEAAQDLEMSL